MCYAINGTTHKERETMIKNIVFDIGMVLVDFRKREYCKELGFDVNTTERIVKGIVERPMWNELDMGTITEQDILDDYISREPDMRAQAQLFMKDLTEIVHSFPDSREWLSDLKAKGYNIYLLTNYPKDMFELHKNTQFDFMDLVSGYVVSSHINVTKPDKRIYEYLLQKYELKAEECVFLDDLEANTAAAASLGFKTITVTDRQAAKQKLYKLLQQNK